MHKVFIGIGSNIGNRLVHLQEAIDLLMELDDTSVCAVSAIYITEPIGDTEQHRFYNGVLLLETSLSPEELRRGCKTIEQNLGRPHSYPRWSPRVIDLDILLYDDLCLRTESLSIPHPELQHRKFVLVPLLDIANTLHPETGKSIRQLLECCKDPSVLIRTKEKIMTKKRQNTD
ncbi:MAG: 2-amino-4-hydroxy-6-hydroxymethyldihydropteridine diphosphokinase [Chlorobium sp.]|nr:MAG: 2-amino-4-hydroxy-6-hydroxymethyldihydropteridine diphosphokinase [Chlorobium sp.]